MKHHPVDFKKSIAFPHKFAGLGDHAIDRSLWCLFVVGGCGFLGWSASGWLKILFVASRISAPTFPIWILSIQHLPWPKLAPSSLCEYWHCVRHDVTPQSFRDVLDGWVSVVVSIQTGSFTAYKFRKRTHSEFTVENSNAWKMIQWFISLCFKTFFFLW